MLLTYQGVEVYVTDNVAKTIERLESAISSCDMSEGVSIYSKPRNIDHEELVSGLEYSPDTGKFRWKTGQLAGLEAGHYCTTRNKKYIRIRFKGQLVLAHVLAWFYVNGSWPQSELDHKNGDGTDNKMSNLRSSNRLKNNSNTSRRRDSKENPNISTTRVGNYAPCVKFNGTSYHLGTYGTLAEAIVVRDGVTSLIPRGESHHSTMYELSKNQRKL